MKRHLQRWNWPRKWCRLMYWRCLRVDVRSNASVIWRPTPCVGPGFSRRMSGLRGGLGALDEV